jgi:ABC-type transport system involved in multi-copper enzyme maturation permease subunit
MSIATELLTLRKRTGAWVLFGLYAALSTLFSYALPYLEGGAPGVPPEVLPDRIPGQVIAGFPFFGGVMALILAVLAVGGEYGWDTLKTLFTQGPGRLRVFATKLTALGIALVPFVLAPFLCGALASFAIAQAEGATVDWPSAWLVIRALAAGWLILGVWAAFGVLLAVATRGTSMAIGIGILYTLVIEGLTSALAESVGFLEPLVQAFVRANAYSLAEPLGLSFEGAAGNGPGAYLGPLVSPSQAAVVLVALALGFLAGAATLLRRRDVS